MIICQYAMDLVAARMQWMYYKKTKNYNTLPKLKTFLVIHYQKYFFVGKEIPKTTIYLIIYYQIIWIFGNVLPKENIFYTMLTKQIPFSW